MAQEVPQVWAYKAGEAFARGFVESLPRVKAAEVALRASHLIRTPRGRVRNRPLAEDVRDGRALEAAVWSFAYFFPEYVLIERSH